MVASHDARVTSVDVLRGLAVLLLVPNIQGGFSLREMATLHPGDRLWAALGTQFTHVDWVGVALWDLVMPAFVFVVGVAMAISTVHRQRAGASSQWLLAQAVLRSASLFVLGMVLDMPRQTSVWLELLPYAIVVAALPWAHWADRWTGTRSPRRTGWLELGVPAIVVASLGGVLVVRPMLLGAYEFNSILTLMGLAYLPAFLLMSRGPRVAFSGALLILALYAAAFVGYTAPGASGHWDNGTNIAHAFDMWLLNALPRSEPYAGNAHGYHTLQFVPMIASMVFGALVGRRIAQRAGERPLALAGWFALAGAVGLASAAITAALGIPLVKSLWTPTWVLFGSALCVLMLAALTVVFDRPGGARLALPLTALGTNALLLYVISTVHRWRIVMYAEQLLGEWLTASTWRPLLQSLIVLAVLWLLAAWLHQRRIRVTL